MYREYSRITNGPPPLQKKVLKLGGKYGDIVNSFAIFFKNKGRPTGISTCILIRCGSKMCLPTPRPTLIDCWDTFSNAKFFPFFLIIFLGGGNNRLNQSGTLGKRTLYSGAV